MIGFGLLAGQTDSVGDEAGQRDSLTAVMESMGIYDTDLRNRGGTDPSTAGETQRLLKILLATLNKAMAQSSMSVLANHGESSTKVFLVGLKRAVFSAQEDMDCSPGSPFSMGSPPQAAQPSDIISGDIPVGEGNSKMPLAESKPEPEPSPAAETSQEPGTPAALEVKNPAALMVGDEVPFRPSISLDTIVNQEIHSLASDIKNIMQTQCISYTSQPSPRLSLRHCWLPSSCFSDYVVPYAPPVSVEGHVEALCEKMDKLIPAPPASPKATSPPPPVTTSSLTAPPPATIQASKTKAEPVVSKTAASSDGGKTSCSSNETSSVKAKTEASSPEPGGGLYSPSHATANSPELNSRLACAAPNGGSNLLTGSLIGQLKPEVFTSLVEIFKDVTKNTVKFYIYSGEEGEDSAVCKEIKVQSEVHYGFSLMSAFCIFHYNYN
ncbi:hypothetical protein XENOCAPTIV_028275 [Xenoophorus captivus]|uniref:Uncharacterized protein n=1 Tax=Xenoophorus captivus TaxID=1517983 RepID=A0ABV0QX23_9TELE